MVAITLNSNTVCVVLFIMLCSVCIKRTGGQKSRSGTTDNQDLIQRIKDRVSVNMSEEWPGWVASEAIDGNNSTKPGCDCCSLAYSQSGDPAPLWWEIDLGMMYAIKLIQFFGEDDERYYDKFKGFNLSISNVSDAFSDIYYTNDKTLPGFKFNIPVPNTLVRHIRITKTDVLLICEIKVFEADCFTGKFGDKCSKACHCDDNLPCDKTTGMCQHAGCKTGWQSAACDTECTKIQYGENCTRNCGKCKDNSACDSVSGACPFGCSEEYTGNLCTTQIEETSVNKAAAIGGASAVVFILVCVAVGVFCYLKRRKKGKALVDNYMDLDHNLTPSQEPPYTIIDSNMKQEDEQATSYAYLNRTPSLETSYATLEIDRNEVEDRQTLDDLSTYHLAFDRIIYHFSTWLPTEVNQQYKFGEFMIDKQQTEIERLYADG